MKSILKGTLVLFIGTLIVKTAGMYFRAALSAEIGSSGMGIYELIFSVYLMIVTLAYSGINTAVIRLSGESKIYGRSLVNTAIRIILPLAVTVGVVLFVLADRIAEGLLNTLFAARPLRILALSVPFMSVSICFSSWYLGQGRTLIPVSCQITEQLLRIAVLKALLSKGVGGLDAAAVAMSCGEVLSCVFVGSIFLTTGGRTGRRRKGIASQIFEICVPIALGNYVSAAVGTAENILLPQKLAVYDQRNAMSAYGMLSGMALPLLMFPSALLSSLSTVLMPSVARSKDGKMVKPYLKFTLAASMLVVSAFICFPYQLGAAVYNNSHIGALVLKLCFIVPLLYTETVISSALNGLGRQKFLVVINCCEQAASLAVIMFAVPVWGISAYITAVAAGCGVSCVIKLWKLLRVSDFSFDVVELVVVPALCAALAGVASRIVCARFFWHRLPLAAGIALGVCLQTAVYIFLCGFTGVVNFDRIKKKQKE